MRHASTSAYRAAVRDDLGITLVEVVAALLVMGMLLPAVFTAYTTVVRGSESALVRLQCVNTGRQIADYYKAQSFENLPPIGTPTVPPGYTGTDFTVSVLVNAVTDDAGVTRSEVNQLNVNVSCRDITVTLPFFISKGGY
jgi:type II secretory pathway pseudopilin PulG